MQSNILYHVPDTYKFHGCNLVSNERLVLSKWLTARNLLGKCVALNMSGGKIGCCIRLCGLFFSSVLCNDIIDWGLNRIADIFVGTFFRYIFLDVNIWIPSNPFVSQLWLKKWLIAVNKWYFGILCPTLASYGRLHLGEYLGENNHLHLFLRKQFTTSQYWYR